MRQGRFTFLISGLLCLYMSHSTAGPIYKWVDDNGTVHYGEKPPEKGATELRIRNRGGVESANNSAPKKSSDPNTQRDKMLKAMESDRLERDKNRKKKQKEQQEHKQKCNRAKDALRSYKESNLIYKLDENGKRVYMPDSYRTNRINKLQSDINKWCK